MSEALSLTPAKESRGIPLSREVLSLLDNTRKSLMGIGILPLSLSLRAAEMTLQVLKMPLGLGYKALGKVQETISRSRIKVFDLLRLDTGGAKMAPAAQ